MKILLCLGYMSLIALCFGQYRYKFSDGYLSVLGGEPEESFDCKGRPYGYYADVASRCKIFHVCVPVVSYSGETKETFQYSFFCGNRTVFSQDSLTCAHPYEAFPCEESEALFDLINSEFGRVIPKESDREGRKLQDESQNPESDPAHQSDSAALDERHLNEEQVDQAFESDAQNEPIQDELLEEETTEEAQTESNSQFQALEADIKINSLQDIIS